MNENLRKLVGCTKDSYRFPVYKDESGELIYQNTENKQWFPLPAPFFYDPILDEKKLDIVFQNNERMRFAEHQAQSDIYKKETMNQIEIAHLCDLAYCKALNNENIENRKKGLSLKVYVDTADGKTVFSQDTLTGIAHHFYPLENITYPKLIRDVPGGMKVIEQIYELHFDVGNRKARVFLNADYIGRKSYFKNKLISAGVSIHYSKQPAKTDELLFCFWTALRASCRSKREYPIQFGWQKSETGNWIFNKKEEGIILWNEVKHLAE